MRIIGGRDYYDSAAMYGIDNSVVFVRSPITTNKHPFKDVTLTDHNRCEEKKVHLFTVAIGGKVYPGACKIFEHPSIRHTYIRDFFYSEEELINSLPSKFLDFYNWHSGSIKNRINAHFDIKQDAYVNWLIENKIVIGNSFHNSKNEGVVDFSEYNDKTNFYANHGELGKLEFYKCLDAVTTHMEIARFVGGILPFFKHIVEISDKSKIVKAGFDIKDSFRKRRI